MNLERSKMLAICITFILVMTVIPFTNIGISTGGYTTYASEPIEISTVEELQAMQYDLEADYVLVNDIDASATREWNWNETEERYEGFEPVGKLYRERLLGGRFIHEPFNGSFDGRGYEITGLYIDRPSDRCIGLFGYVDLGGEIRNVGVVEVDVRSSQDVGALVGLNYGTVENTYATGNVSGNSLVGALTGRNYGTVENSYATGTVSGDKRVGGLVGSNSGTVVNSHYNIDEMLINDGNHITTSGIFSEQYTDWFSSGFDLDISDYSDTLVPVGDHYEISNRDGLRDLLGFADREGYKFRQATDIDLYGEPGLYIPYLAGYFDGNNHTIFNVYVNTPFVSNLGLFGYVGLDGEIRNVSVVDSFMRGYRGVGNLVGYNEGTVSNSYSIGEVSGYWNVGGLVGYNSRGTVKHSNTSGYVSGNQNVGGLVGINDEGTVSNSYAAGTVNGDENIGGLVGRNYNDWRGDSAIISNSYATGNVSGTSTVGGLVGLNWWRRGTVSNSYATGTVIGDRVIGGLIGGNGGTVSNSYATGNVNGNNSAGGLIGGNGGDVGKVSYSYATGDVIGYLNVGGLIGEQEYSPIRIYNDIDFNTLDIELSHQQENSKISNTSHDSDEEDIPSHSIYKSFSTGDVFGNDRVGGLVGGSILYSIIDSYATGDVAGNDSVGGLVGYSISRSITNSYAAGDVTGKENVGGLVGLMDGGLAGVRYGATSVNNSYARGDVTGKENVGGLIGHNWGTIEHSYSMGRVEGDVNVGGIIGINREEYSLPPELPIRSSYWWSPTLTLGSVHHSFHDKEASGQEHAIGFDNGTAENVHTLSTTLMKSNETFIDAGWDFESTWSIDADRNDGYPYLQWQEFDEEESSTTLSLELILGIIVIIAATLFLLRRKLSSKED